MKKEEFFIGKLKIKLADKTSRTNYHLFVKTICEKCISHVRAVSAEIFHTQWQGQILRGAWNPDGHSDTIECGGEENAADRV